MVLGNIQDPTGVGVPEVLWFGGMSNSPAIGVGGGLSSGTFVMRPEEDAGCMANGVNN